jgi:FkbM family methyltransferase
MFDSNNYENYDPELVTSRFRKCTFAEERINRHFKSISRITAIEEIGIHLCTLKLGHKYCHIDGTPLNFKNHNPNLEHIDDSCNYVDFSIGHINHYAKKSRQEYLCRKLKGRATVTEVSAQSIIKPGKYESSSPYKCDDFNGLHQTYKELNHLVNEFYSKIGGLHHWTYTFAQWFVEESSRYNFVSKAAYHLQSAKDFIANKEFNQAEALLQEGIQKAPLLIDNYGHPTFKKELLRLYLTQGNWELARQLIPRNGDLGGNNWHEILFARAYESNSDLVNAKIWWAKVYTNDPKNSEAHRFFEQIHSGLLRLKPNPEWLKVVAPVVKSKINNQPIIFDVGANVGQSITTYLTAWPLAHVYAFEPISSTYKTLASNLKNHPGAKLYDIALSDASGSASMTNDKNSVFNKLLQGNDDISASCSVRTMRGDEFCSINSIHSIQYLKVDAEGHDMKVLEGFGEMINNQNIDFIEVESAMNRTNNYHISIEQFKDFFESRGYRLTSVFEVVREGRTIMLRRANLVFAADRIITS